MEKPKIEDRILRALEGTSLSISALKQSIEWIYQDWKFPIKTPAEEMEPLWKEQKEEKRVEKQLRLLEKQNKILMRTVMVAVIGIVITAIVGVADLVVRVYFNK